MKYRLTRNLLIDTLLSPVEGLLRFAPGVGGIILRYAYYRCRLAHVGKRVLIGEGVHLVNPKWISLADYVWIDHDTMLAAGPHVQGERHQLVKENRHFKGKRGQLTIGRGCHVAPFSIIQAHGGVQIGDDCSLGAGSKIYSTSQHYRNPRDSTDKTIYKYTPRAPQDEQFLIVGAVVLEHGAALAVNSVILPGATIGLNSWVGANSCVVSDIPPNAIAGGNPAVVLKKRFDNS